MKSKYLLHLFFLVIISTIPVFFQEGVYAYDSFAFYNDICMPGYNHAPTYDNIPLAKLVIENLPCDSFIIKLILVGLIFSSVLIAAKTGELLDKEYGWMNGVFVFLAPLSIFVSLKFENDTFAIPFLFAFVYFLVRYKTQPERKVSSALWAGVVLLIAIGFWNAAAYYIMALALTSFGLFVISLPFLAQYGKLAFDQIVGNTLINENFPIIGFKPLLFLFIGFIAPLYPAMTYFLGILGFLNAKFVILAIPFLTIGVFNTILKYGGTEKKVWMLTFLVIGTISALGTGLLVGLHPLPSEVEWESINYTLSVHSSTGLPIHTDFQFGYLLDYKGYYSYEYGFLEEGWQNGLTDSLVITHLELDCPIISVKKPYFIYQC